MWSSPSQIINPNVALLAVVLVAVAMTQATHGLPLDQLKRARSSSSSLIPFPRVGRSLGSHEHTPSSSPGGFGSALYYGQKRTGKSSLIPFPRVGRGGASTWDVELPGELDRLLDVYSRKHYENDDSAQPAYNPQLMNRLLQHYLGQEEDSSEHLSRRPF